MKHSKHTSNAVRLAVRVSLLLTAGLLLGACGQDNAPGSGSDIDGDDTARALSQIDVDGMTRRTVVLADDKMEGRAPMTPGETRTLEYLQQEFAAAGLIAAGEKGFLQPVPLVEITASAATTMALGDESLRYGDDFVVWTKRVVDEISIRASDLVFAGYGIVAPEYGRDDYAGVDWTGKTAVVLVNDPGFATGDPEVFNGPAMTYYGRWTYKFEEAARHGADGVLIIHETAPAAYGWHVVRNGGVGPKIDLVTDNDGADRTAVEGWIQREVAERLFDRAGLDLEAMKQAALDADFLPVSLEQTASVEIRNSIREQASYNVVGKLTGSERPDEYIIYTAHWDHLGMDPTLEGDQIFNGAADNAIGVAALLEIAEAYAALEHPPKRSVMFAAVTAEESGLLGSLYFARNPPVPTRDLVAVLNMDIMLHKGPETDTTLLGLEQSALGELAREAAGRQGRQVRPHPSPQSGYFYRSDNFSLARSGVPGLSILNAGPADSVYVREHYHKPADEYRDDWDLSGAVQDAQLYFDLGYRLANSDAFPAWRETSEFRAARVADGR